VLFKLIFINKQGEYMSFGKVSAFISDAQTSVEKFIDGNRNLAKARDLVENNSETIKTAVLGVAVLGSLIVSPFTTFTGCAIGIVFADKVNSIEHTLEKAARNVWQPHAKYVDHSDLKSEPEEASKTSFLDSLREGINIKHAKTLAVAAIVGIVASFVFGLSVVIPAAVALHAGLALDRYAMKMKSDHSARVLLEEVLTFRDEAMDYLSGLIPNSKVNQSTPNK
jgi:hypothetical protein